MHPAKSAVLSAFLCIAPALLAQSPTTVSLTITSSGSPVTTIRQGTVVTLTATVNLVSGGPAAPPGQIQFCEVKSAPLQCTDIRLLGTQQLLSNGSASFKFFPGPGNHVYQAQFLGTHLEAASASPVAALSVTPYAPTATVLTSTGPPGNYSLTATVTAFGGLSPPTGTASFSDATNAGYALASAPLVPATSSPGFDLAYTSPQFQTQYAPQIAVADVNGDGTPDILVSQYSNPGKLSTLLGNRDGTFTSAWTYSLSPVSDQPGAGKPVIADFNDDGKLDFVVLITISTNGFASSNRIQIFMGNGDGTFVGGQTLQPPTGADYAGQLAVGDFNGDGIPDLAVDAGQVNSLTGQHVYTLSVFFGKGDGTFVQGPATPLPDEGSAFAVADFNRDGKADIAISHASTSTNLAILLGNGDGTFTAASLDQPAGQLPQIPIAADFNEDGIPDLAVIDDNLSSRSVSLLLGNGDGTFAPPQTLITGVGFAYELGDFNGDGHADLALEVPNPTPELLVLQGNGDGTFATPRAFPYSIPVVPVAAADFNGDGVTDIAASVLTTTTVGDIQGQISVLLSGLASSSTATATANGISIVGTGPHRIDASYTGDSMDKPSSGSLSLTAQPVQTTLTFSAAPANSGFGQPVTLAAAIAPDTPQQEHLPTGTVTFSIGSTTVGTATVANGAATFTSTTLPIGTDNITATYSGDANFASSSATAMETVTGYGSSISLSASPNPAGFGQPVTLTASVSGAGTTLVPTGTVTFLDGPTQLASAPLDASGHAGFTASALALGAHTLTASYAGDAVFHAATSAPFTETVIAPDFSIALSSPTISLAAYRNTTSTVTLASIGAFSDSLTLSCGNAPKYVTCIFTPQPASLTANGSIAVSFYLDTDSIVGGYGKSGPLHRSPPAPRTRLNLLFAPLGLVTLLAFRRRMRSSLAPRLPMLLLLAIAAIPAALILTSCGGNQIDAVPAAAPGTYTIPITATGAATHISHIANLTLTITP